MKKRVLTAVVGIPILIGGVFFAPIWLFGVIIAVICGFVAFELMRCAIGQAPKRLYVSSILSAVAIAIFGGLDLRMAAIILLFLFFVLSCEMMACFSTPRKISMEMVAISMLAGGVLPMMLSTLLRIAQFETTISIPELLQGNSTLVRITHDGLVGRVRAFLPFVVAFGSDAGAYFCGRAFGKKQLAPAISPHKTVAGGIGGAVCGALMALLGAACALILCAVFYGTMVYQLADRTDGAQAKQAEPAKTLALGSGEMEGESRERVQMGGKLCDVLTRTYLLADGTRAQAITASPAAYIERMKQEGWQAQLVTGFAIGETDAVYARSGENAMLCAKDGETVYMIIAQADEQTLYALGVDAETK